jgi:hypothetical protein
MSNIKSLIGNVYNRLVVISYSHTKKYVGNSGKGNYIVYWNCECSCGNTATIEGRKLKTGHTKSCGCLNQESRSSRGRHKEAGKTREYNIWAQMKMRCYNKNNHAFARYGGRGITVCDEWLNSFERFIQDMGRAPAKHSIERLNNNNGYYKGNCRWASVIEQNNNKRNNVNIEYNNEIKTVSNWCRELGLNVKRTKYRIASGWSTKSAFELPKSSRHKTL